MRNIPKECNPLFIPIDPMVKLVSQYVFSLKMHLPGTHLKCIVGTTCTEQSMLKIVPPQGRSAWMTGYYIYTSNSINYC